MSKPDAHASWYDLSNIFSEAEHGYASTMPMPDILSKRRIKTKKSQGNRWGIVLNVFLSHQCRHQLIKSQMLTQCFIFSRLGHLGTSEYIHISRLFLHAILQIWNGITHRKFICSYTGLQSYVLLRFRVAIGRRHDPPFSFLEILAAWAPFYFPKLSRSEIKSISFDSSSCKNNPTFSA